MGENHSVSLTVPAERKQLATIRDFIAEQATRANLTTHQIDDMIQAVDEAATNIIVHGYQEAPGWIEIVFTWNESEARMILRDRAPVFDPRSVPPPDITLPLHKRKAGGLGVHLIRQCIDEVEHCALEGGGNELVLIKYKQEKGRSG